MKKSTLILAINTASLNTGVALLEKTDAMAGAIFAKVLTEKSWLSKSDEAEKLLPEIYSMLKHCKSHALKRTATFSDIKEIYVVKGPGSFTGLRIGVTVANTIAYLNGGTSGGASGSGCQLFAISTFEYWRSIAPFPILIYAGSGGVYLHKNSTTRLINLKDLNKILRTEKIKEVFGDITLEQKAVLKNVKFIDFKESFGNVIAKIIAKKIKPVKIVEPLYIKQPAISVNKKLICSL